MIYDLVVIQVLTQIFRQQYSNYSALEAVFAALMLRNLNTTTSKSKYMYNNTLLYMSFFAPYFHQGKTCTYFKRYENLKNYNMQHLYKGTKSLGTMDNTTNYIGFSAHSISPSGDFFSKQSISICLDSLRRKFLLNIYQKL